LIEIRDLQVGPAADVAGIGRHRAENELEQRGLAGTVRSDDPDAIAAHDAQIEVADHDALSERLGYALELGDEPAGALGGVKRHRDVALSFAAGRALVSQQL